MRPTSLLALTLLATLTARSCWASPGNLPQPTQTGKNAIVYFTRDLSPKGLKKVYAYINKNIQGRVALKLHTGEKYAPNILPPPWIKELQAEIPNSTIVETNTYYYPSDRYTTQDHRETLKINGWTFSPVDILDEEGATWLPVKNGRHFKKMSVGSHLLNYDSLVVLTHFKGHVAGGFGGANKNVGVGCADKNIGKALIHTGDNEKDWGLTSKQWAQLREPLMERITESSKAVLEHFGGHSCFINVLRKMSVSCDCEGIAAKPVTAPDVGILGSTDILATDQASVDMVYALKEKTKDLQERINSRQGLRQLSYMRELGMGKGSYVIYDIDAEEAKAKAKTPALKNTKQVKS